MIDFSDGKNEHPLETLKQTLIIWISYLIVSKQPLYFNIFNFLLITVIYLINNYNEYFKKKYKENKEQIQNLNKVSNILSIILIISCVIGLYLFYNKEKDFKFWKSYCKIKCIKDY